jgi:modulator of FtsH protease HflK
MMEKEDDGAPRPMNNDGKGPWDFPGSGGGDNQPPKKGRSKPVADLPDANKGDEPKRPVNPWEPKKTEGQKPRGPSLEELFRRPGGGGGGKGGGGFGGLPQRANGKSWWPLIVGGLALVWVGWTSVHQIEPNQQGVVTLFGKYSRTVDSGVAFTFPAPFERMQKVNSRAIQTMTIGSKTTVNDNLILTKDQSLMDLTYDIRWSIKSPVLFLFKLDDPERAIREVGESAMRATLANYDFNQANGDSRGAVQQQVRQLMQKTLDEYESGIFIEGIALKETDPPEEVKEAFRNVNAAQQRREKYINDARAYASSQTQLAIGETTEFDKIYEQYKQAPEVTRRRLYYETMEQVLSQVDKTIIETGNVTPYLPLPELRRRAQAADDTVVVTGKTQ